MKPIFHNAFCFISGLCLWLLLTACPGGGDGEGGGALSGIIVELDAGSFHSCARIDTGQVKCWGANSSGQLGLGDTDGRGDQPGEMGSNLPAVELGTGRTAVDLVLGDGHTCARLDNGIVKCWGGNSSGQLGLGDTNDRGDQANEMGDALPGVILGTGRMAVQLSAGFNHTCARLDNGQVKCWGANNSGQLGLGDTTSRGVQPVDMGDNLPPVDLGSGQTAVQLAAGNNHTCAQLDNGTVKCWGSNISGQLGLGDTINRGDQPNEMGNNLPSVDLGSGMTAVQVVAGGNHTCARLDNATVKCWGDNSDGQLLLRNTNNRGDEANEMGDNLPTVNLGTGRTVVQLAVGDNHNCALLDNAQVKCWGHGRLGQVGWGFPGNIGDDQLDPVGDTLNPLGFGTGRTATLLASGGNHNCVRLDNGQVKCWGFNVSGQLGLGDTTSRGNQLNQMGDNLPAVSIP